MPDREAYERKIEHLCGEVDALRAMLLAVAQMLPERGMYVISHEAARLSREVDRDAAARPNDRRRDYAAGYWDTAATFEEAMDMRREELETGAWVRLIQPAKIPAGDQLFPDRGW